MREFSDKIKVPTVMRIKVQETLGILKKQKNEGPKSAGFALTKRKIILNRLNLIRPKALKRHSALL